MQAKICRSVDFPAPDFPIIAISSPSRISAETPWRALNSLAFFEYFYFVIKFYHYYSSDNIIAFFKAFGVRIMQEMIQDTKIYTAHTIRQMVIGFQPNVITVLLNNPAL